MNPNLLRLMFLILRGAPMFGAITASQNILTAVSAYIDSAIMVQSAQRGPLATFLGHIIRF